MSNLVFLLTFAGILLRMLGYFCFRAAAISSLFCGLLFAPFLDFFGCLVTLAALLLDFLLFFELGFDDEDVSILAGARSATEEESSKAAVGLSLTQLSQNTVSGLQMVILTPCSTPQGPIFAHRAYGGGYGARQNCHSLRQVASLVSSHV